MDARKGNIYEILNGNKQFLIPVYQRYYSWDVEQCKRLWNDIVEIETNEKREVITEHGQKTDIHRNHETD